MSSEHKSWTDEYAKTMEAGRREYSDVLEVLDEHGIPAYFTQTGGMCAAIEAQLEGNVTLLITESQDPLSWTRDEHTSWGVGLYETQDDFSEALRFNTTDDPSIDGLIELVRQVMLGKGENNE